ncbi:MAG: IreB family regulatory phosphoprotein [Bacilli bacterium]|nr:IreB family regulatory phosphoprotein [Bacilli bacterium]
MESNTTYLFEVKDFDDALILDTLKDVYLALEERGYNPINQLVGYLMSGDPGYISSHKEARNKIMKLDRTRILEVMVKNYIKNLK